MTDNKTLLTLEYDKILDILAQYTQSEPTKKYVKGITPATDKEQVEYGLDLTEQADILAYEHCASISLAFDDMTEILEACKKNAVLSIADILKTGKLLRTCYNMRKAVDAVSDVRLDDTREIVNSLYTDKSLEKAIFEAFSGENEVSDNASHELKSIRRQIRLCNERIRQKLASYLSGSLATYLQDNIVTVRNNRYVLPVKAECRSSVEGLVHDRSATGSTIYIEPIGVVGLNNELKGYLLDEAKEIDNILRKFSGDIAASVMAIEESYRALIILDSIFAKASYARAIKGVRAEINDVGIVKIIEGRHPLIAASKVVPVSVELGKDFDIMVITGPNTGGKTVLLKLVGLICLMSCSGMFVPCKTATSVCVFDKIFCDIGDNQSIENNLSTFSSHISNITSIVNEATDNCLCLLDELGGGTNPAEGSALAIAIIEYLRGKNCRSVTSSHYDDLKEYAFSTDRVTVATMDFDPITLKPTYKLLLGIAGGSKALEIARNFGLKDEILQQAKSRIGSGRVDFDKVMAMAEKARREAEELKENAAREYFEAEKIKTENKALSLRLEERQRKLDEKMQKSVKELMSDYVEQAEEIIEELKENLAKGDESALFEARKNKKRLEKASFEENYREDIEKIGGKIAVGDDVYVESLKSKAVVLSINEKKNECLIKAGIVSTTIKIKDCVKIKKVKREEPKGKIVRVARELKNDDVKQEVNLIGMRSDEALATLERYLHDALGHGYSEVRIVHGKGTGILRKAVAEYLKTCPIVSEFRLGNYGEGDMGVTIAKLI
ncbi:MAG: endonuclease MutS2 [Eubacteriales bacterium]|nr:endonuclease MutS2 [Eubacteriales bacterium]